MYPGAGALQSTRPSESGDPPRRQPGHSDRGSALVWRRISLVSACYSLPNWHNREGSGAASGTSESDRQNANSFRTVQDAKIGHLEHFKIAGLRAYLQLCQWFANKIRGEMNGT